MGKSQLKEKRKKTHIKHSGYIFVWICTGMNSSCLVGVGHKEHSTTIRAMMTGQNPMDEPTIASRTGTTGLYAKNKLQKKKHKLVSQAVDTIKCA